MHWRLSSGSLQPHCPAPANEPNLTHHRNLAIFRMETTTNYAGHRSWSVAFGTDFRLANRARMSTTECASGGSPLC